MKKKGYVFIAPDGTVRLFVVKLSPFIRPLIGERILAYEEPEYDQSTQFLEVITPITDSIKFNIKQKD